MSISKIVEEIIGRRNSRLPAIQGKKEELHQMLTLLDEFDYFKSEIIDAEGNVLDGKYKVMADKNPEMPLKLNVMSTAECRKRIKTALDECDKVYKRFSRDSINIAVVGEARIGKSKLLQAISNLNGLVIPSADGSDCTGAVSIIENKPGVELKAEITFKTRNQMIDIIQTYLDRIIIDKSKRLVVRSLEQINNENFLEEVHSRKTEGAIENNLIKYLRAYVESYKEWIPFIEQQDIVLYKAEEIQEYVAQHNGKKEGEGKKTFYKYLAVDTCRISCTFDYQEAGKITLLDTVGFGDNAIGIEDELIKVVNDKSDAVIFLVLPRSGKGHGIPKEIIEILKKIKESCGEKKLSKWLSWLINHAPKHPEIKDNIGLCKMTLDTLIEDGMPGEIKKIINVIDQQQVREEFLIPLLNTLMSNLDDIDDLYLEDLRVALDAVRKEYGSFCLSAKKLMTSQLANSSNMHPQMNKDIRGMFNKLKGQLNDLAKDEKEKRDLPCDALKESVSEIIESLKDETLIPSKETLKAQLRNDDHSTVYINCCNKIRAEITQKFAEVDLTLQKLVEETKNSIADILISDDGCRLGCVKKPIQEKPKYEWLKLFAEGDLDEESYKNIYPAFCNVYNFDFSVKGFLTYEVRACLDSIDPFLMDTPPGLIGNNDERTIDNIRFWLERNLLDISDDLESNLNELFRKPHRAFFALIKEFSDKVIYSEGVYDEWYSLLSLNYRVIWAEECRNMAIEVENFEVWSDLLKKLLELNAKCEVFSV